MLSRSSDPAYMTIACPRSTGISPRNKIPIGIVDPGARPAWTLWHENLDNNIPCCILTYFYLITSEELFAWVGISVCAL